MASLLKGMSIGQRLVTKGGKSLPKVGSTRCIVSAHGLFGEGPLADELFARGWACGPSFPKPVATKPQWVSSSSPPVSTSAVETNLLDELYSRGWFTSECETVRPTGKDVEANVLDELYQRGWFVTGAHNGLSDEVAAKKCLDNATVDELFARGWTWESSTLQVSKKCAVTEAVPPSVQESDDVLQNELFARGWESTQDPVTFEEPMPAEKKEVGTFGEELFARGW